MKKNYIVTTGIPETWEFNENNFILGQWCEFYENNDFNYEEYKNKISQNTTIIKNKHHWSDNDKRNNDYKYLKSELESLLEIISEHLSKTHNISESKEYWRVIVFGWLTNYVIIIFDKWETIRIFFEKNKNKKFYSNFISLNDSDYIPKNHLNFFELTQKHKWNHLVFLRLFNYLNIKNISFIKKDNITQNTEIKSYTQKKNLLITYALRIVDKFISKFAFKFNKIIFESFYFPKKEFLKICFRCKLIPSKYSNFFDLKINENSQISNNKRNKFKTLLSKVESKDDFIKFLLSNLHKDMPMSYLENFDLIKKTFSKVAKKKKVIFSMTSVENKDNFKIYLAESRKVSTKHIRVSHGGGLKFNENDHTFDLYEKISDKIILWEKIKKNNIYENLSPTLPFIKSKNLKPGKACSIIFVEPPKYLVKFPESLLLEQSVEFFNELVQFVNQLNPEIRSQVKFRAKTSFYIGFNSEAKFGNIFGKSHIDKVSAENTYKKTLVNSKLIISTYPQTAFSEAMYCNVPTLLIIKRNHYQFSKDALNTFNNLKKNKIAFESFNDAAIHIHKHWEQIDLWWKSENVQAARKFFLLNFCNVKPNWSKEWSDYTYNLLSSY